MKHLIKNMIFSIWDNKVHFFSLILLLLTSLSLTWGIFSANASFNETLTNWKLNSNASDAILDLNASNFFSHKIAKDQIDDLKQLILSLQNEIKNNKEFKDITFTYRDYRAYYDNKNNKKALLIPYDDKTNDYAINNKVDKIFYKDVIPCNYENDRCVFLSTEYAKKSNIKVGDILDFNNFFSDENTKKTNDSDPDPYKFKVNGLANSFDVSYPKIDLIDTVPQTKNSEVCYINQNFLLNNSNDDYRTKSFADRDQILLFHFPKDVNKARLSNKFYEQIISKIWDNQKNILPPEKLAFPTLGYYDKYNNKFITNNLWYSRTTTLDYFVEYENKISIIFLLSINLTIFFVVAIIARKRIDNDEDNILIFKSLGFKKKSITFVYSFYPFVFAIFLSIFSLGFSFLFQKLLFSLFNNFFMVNITKISFSWISFSIDICYYALFISLFTFH
ncbi:ABC transporter permease [symbiont of Argiope bruennichi]|uniref:ABC transporter permease n=1 Tax=symbiont of Argiope bruennichi TaxID=2810479 RepID=UPI003DA6C9C2